MAECSPPRPSASLLGVPPFLKSTSIDLRDENREVGVMGVGLQCLPPSVSITDPKFHLLAGEFFMGVKKTGRGRRKVGSRKRRMRAKIRHRKDK